MTQGKIDETLEHLFRRESGKIVAYLTRFLGVDHLDLAESVVQDALLKAVQSWPNQGLPDNPAAWLMRVAKNSALDAIKGGKALTFNSEWLDELGEHTPAGDGPDPGYDEELRDDQLQLFFICCNPGLTREARIALTLKTVCGFSVGEIARAFLTQEETIAQRIVRAKQKVMALDLKFEVPAPEELEARIESVLEVIYFLFNEGYLATQGAELVRRELCQEAIYRATLLYNHPLGRLPKVSALLSLMHFQASRFQARLDPEGELLLLEEQDRSLWDRAQIQLGLSFLELASTGQEISSYHLQAGIASCHALAPSFDQTDWRQILVLYDLLLATTDSPVVELNRAVALAQCQGLDAGVEAVQRLGAVPAFAQYSRYYAVLAELYHRKGDAHLAREHFERALALTANEPERRLILKRLKSCLSGG